MIEASQSAAFGRGRSPLAVVLGTNEIASAVAVHLVRSGFAVVLSHDPALPVIRRGMAFHDVLHGEAMMVDGIGADLVERAIGLLALTNRPDRVGVTRLGLVDLLPIAPFDLLVDARMNKYAVVPDLRHLAGVTVGLGPGFAVAVNCDVAVETRPARNGTLLTHGATDAPDGQSSPLGEHGRERFAYSAGTGRWHTSFEIGARVYKGMVLGHLGRDAVTAPLDGVIRGLARDGSEVPARVKLLEIDPRNRWQTQWTGIDERGRTIARAVVLAADFHRHLVGTEH